MVILYSVASYRCKELNLQIIKERFDDLFLFFCCGFSLHIPTSKPGLDIKPLVARGEAMGILFW